MVSDDIQCYLNRLNALIISTHLSPKRNCEHEKKVGKLKRVNDVMLCILYVDVFFDTDTEFCLITLVLYQSVRHKKTLSAF